jgi:xylan 1,4-beta-xylosidase
MTGKKTYEIKEGAKAAFYNNADFCIGTGRMGLALRKDYMEQLKLVQDNIGFRYIRGHGLFCDDMAIFHEYKDKDGNVVPEYNFTYLDNVMDSYRSVGLRPFLELGFMPKKMASGEQTIFYWQGNTTPPKSYDSWTAMVRATLRHLRDRYGADDVVTWPIEVWNEPNLPGFWKDADMQEYFKLFRLTFLAIKEVDKRFRVGGPAICGVNDEVWTRSFLEFCRENNLKPDFITRHHYTTEVPEYVGHYGYAKLSDADEGLAGLKVTRDIVDSFPEFKDSEIHITEFNTSYIPNCPLHDTNRNAAYIAYLLSKLGDVNESYSYWTFGDVFEEMGVPFTPFHGGFGLVANGLIPKPTFWTFNFFKKLQGECVLHADDAIVMKNNDRYCGVAFNKSRNKSEEQELSLSFKLPVCKAGDYVVVTKTVDEATCNPLKVWHDLGEPAYPSKEQNDLIREAAHPLVATTRLHTDGTELELNLELRPNAVIYFEILAVEQNSDRGYSYERVMD